MEIIHESGKTYDLKGVQLKFSRTNPFFNDYGEQSLPCTLPPTIRNRELLDYLDNMAGINKSSQRINATIRHGVFSIPCRQSILSANKKKGFETSFYLNAGAFYEKIKDIPLSTVFEKKTIKFSSVTDAIIFCKGLWLNEDNRFACFHTRLSSGSLNAVDGHDDKKFYNEIDRIETVDEKKIRVPAGFYISPFIKVMHLLDELFKYFGYQLADSFFSRTEPFKDMVFVNNTIDTIVNAEIKYCQIIPDCMVKTILDIFRYKFCCEFIPDETRKIINIVLFDDNLKDKPSSDLTDCIAGKYTIAHPAAFKQLKLSCERMELTLEKNGETSDRKPVLRKNTTENSGDEFNTLVDLLKKYPTAEYNHISGEFIRKGYKGTTPVIQRVGTICLDYYAGGVLETENKESPDTMPYMFATGSMSDTNSINVFTGKGRALNSSIILDTANESTPDIKNDVENEELKPIICFSFKNGNKQYGTILNYDRSGNKLWNYTLAYHGPDGLYERFWRNYDNMLRNSFLEIKADLLLQDVQKVSLSEYKKIIIEGQELLPSVIQYTPDSRDPLESTFLTTKLYEPLSVAISETDRFYKNISRYAWDVKFSRSNGSSPKNRWIYKEEPATIYYAPPTSQEYLKGGRYHEVKYPVGFYRSISEDPEDGILTVWLEAVLS